MSLGDSSIYLRIEIRWKNNGITIENLQAHNGAIARLECISNVLQTTFTQSWIDGGGGTGNAPQIHHIPVHLCL